MNNDLVNYKMNDGSILSLREFNDFIQRKTREIDDLIVANVHQEKQLIEMKEKNLDVSVIMAAEDQFIENQLKLVKLRANFDYDTKHTLAFRKPTNAD